MLSVTHRNPDGLLVPLRHHARALEPLVQELFQHFVLVCEPSPTRYTLRQGRVGPNSWSITNEDTGQVFHLRGYPPYTAIEVLDLSAGVTLTKLATRVEVRRWAGANLP